MAQSGDVGRNVGRILVACRLLAAGCRLLPFNEFRAAASTAEGLASLRAPRKRHGYVAPPAEQSIVLQSAFAAPIGNRDDVIGFPSRTRGAPQAQGGAISHRGLRSGPLPVRLDDIESADLTDALVSLLDLLADVPRTASNLPFVNA